MRLKRNKGRSARKDRRKPRRRRKRLSPYRRLEEELRNAREALKNAVNAYIDVRYALCDAVRYLDHPPQGWTHEDTQRLERIRGLGSGVWQ